MPKIVNSALDTVVGQHLIKVMQDGELIVQDPVGGGNFNPPENEDELRAILRALSEKYDNNVSRMTGAVFGKNCSRAAVLNVFKQLGIGGSASHATPDFASTSSQKTEAVKTVLKHEITEFKMEVNGKPYILPRISPFILDDIDLGKAVMLYGHKGTGKTSLAHVLVQIILGAQMYALSITEETEPEDLEGQWITTLDKETGEPHNVFIESVFVKAMREGAKILIDEIDNGSPKFTAYLHKLLEGDIHDGNVRMILSQNGGEEIVAEKGFGFIGTANTLGFGNSGLYLRSTQDRAFWDRFSVYEIEYLPEKEEIDILVHMGIDKDVAKRMVKVAVYSRELFNKGEIPDIISTRRLVDWGDKWKRWPGDRTLATEAAITNRFDMEYRNIISEQINRLFDGADDLIKIKITK